MSNRSKAQDTSHHVVDPSIETDQPGLENVRNAVHNRIWSRLPRGSALRRDVIAGLSSAISNVPDGMANGALLGVRGVVRS